MKEVLLFVLDGLKELRNIFLEEYPKARHQACWVHIDRAISRNIRRSDYREVFPDLKMIYQSKSKKEARKHYDDFILRYEARYPKAVNILRNCPSLFTFYLFPE